MSPDDAPEHHTCVAVARPVAWTPRTTRLSATVERDHTLVEYDILAPEGTARALPSTSCMNIEWNIEKSRFEAEVNGQMAIADCLTLPGQWIVTHVEVPVVLRGGGVASALAAGIVEHARRESKRIVPQCPFMVAYFERHPEARDVLAD